MRLVLIATVLLASTACFPTYQSARIEPGLQATVDVMAIGGHRVSYDVYGRDYMLAVTPAYGFGKRFEVGLPGGVYRTGRGSTYPLALPYAKLALGDPDDRDHLAIFAQANGSIGTAFSYEYRSWEPQVMVATIGSSGNGSGGDDFYFPTRYAQRDQSMLVAAFSAEFHTPAQPVIELGVLRNAFTTDRSHEVYDLFVRMKVRLYETTRVP